ncbi:hypothetical protein O6H91_14G000600 [Diphasiastrum complanatum]|uniref:Uncharacterized protein n=1 Tax=Diphasiastrum complanatum TaxID=34168 RepID=A0ACC2BKQ3_DIPCM|nr:hypothetical protein O6H91_14G000600 [Diphasiastrum complanatum]
MEPYCCSADQGQSMPDTCAVLLLPLDLMRRVFSQLDCIDLIHCSLVCKKWHKQSCELREDWKEEYFEACLVRGFNVSFESKAPRARLEAYLAGTPD